MKNSLFPSERGGAGDCHRVFLILTAVCIGLRPEHFLMAGILVCSLPDRQPVSWQWRCCRFVHIRHFV